MKLKKVIFISLIISLIIFSGSISAFAMNTGFSTREMNSEDQHTFLSNINLTLISDEPQKSTFTCFDVSESGQVAIGFANDQNKYISVYDANGKFQYGYVFNCNQSFGVQWDSANLIIYFVRSDVAASFDSNGANVESRTIEDTADNNSYWNRCVFSKEKTIDTNRYTAKNNMGILNIFASSYSQLLKTDSNGNETIIYDGGTTQTAQTVLFIIAVLIFAALVTALVIRRFLRAKRQ